MTTRAAKFTTETTSTTREGKVALKITCPCGTHTANTNSAVITNAATIAALSARKGTERDERVHGFVVMANHPARMMQVANARKGVFAA